MAPKHRSDRRTFLRNAGAAAFGVASTGTSRARAATGAPTATERYDFDTVLERAGTNCVKVDQQNRLFGKGSVRIGMGVADMDFRVAPCVTEALQERLRHENWGYPDMVTTQEEMAGVITSWNKRRYGLDIDPATIELCTGVHPGIITALQTFSPRGTRVLMQTPAYDGFYSDLRFTGNPPAECPLKIVDGRYAMDFEAFERGIAPDTKTYILCNPHNPTGNCWSAADLLHIGRICLRRGVILLADEIHCDYVTRGNKFTPFASLPDRDVVRNSITLTSASKAFGLAGHKIGWFYSTSPELLARMRANHRIDLPTLGLVANRAALVRGDAWLDQAAEYINGNHDFVQDFLSSRLPLLKAVKPQATYLVWVDVTEMAERIGARGLAAEVNRGRATADYTPEKVVERFFVEKAQVQLNPGSNYGLGGANHLRMNIAAPRRQVENGLTNLAAALRGV